MNLFSLTGTLCSLSALSAQLVTKSANDGCSTESMTMLSEIAERSKRGNQVTSSIPAVTNAKPSAAEQAVSKLRRGVAARISLWQKKAPLEDVGSNIYNTSLYIYCGINDMMICTWIM